MHSTNTPFGSYNLYVDELFFALFGLRIADIRKNTAVGVNQVRIDIKLSLPTYLNVCTKWI